jgi:ATP-dependent exoDNAse (exonuclease V) alpha subunit
MRVLSQAWTDSGGEVLGLAPSAQAASELGRSIGVHTDMLCKLTWTLAHAPRDHWPDWVRRVGRNTLVIIDEAGQVATAELAAAAGYVTARGGIVRLIGDDQQLAAVGAGGVLRDIQHTIGAVTLSKVRRFDDPAEAAATLAVREGDAGALGFYADHRRIHVGDISSVTDQAYPACRPR